MTVQTQQPMSLIRLQAYLQQDPANSRLLTEMIYCCLAEQQSELAHTYWLQLHAQQPDAAATVYLQGLIAVASQQYVIAADIFHRLLQQDRAEPLLYQAAYCQLQLGQPEQALALLNEACLAGAGLDCRLLQARTYYQLQHYPEAIRLLDLLCQQQPDCAPAQGLLAQIYFDYEDWHAASRHASAALALQPQNQAAATVQGYLALQQQDYGQARQWFSQVVQQQPLQSRSLLGLAVVAMFRQQYQEAEQYVLQTLQQQPGLFPAINMLAWLYLLTDRFALARAQFIRGLEVDRSYGEMYGGLAVLDVIAKDFASARQQVARSLKLNNASFAGNFARILLLEQDQRLNEAQQVWQRLMDSKVNAQGQTMEQAIVSQIRDYLKTASHSDRAGPLN